MDPTQEQLNARLNPTATSVSTPVGGVFRSTAGDATLYIREGNALKVFDATSLLTPQEKQQARNYGEQIALAKQKLSSQYGFNFDSVPAYNMGDFQQQFIASGGGYTQRADGGYSINTQQADISSFLSAPKATASTRTINDTPNTLGTLPPGTPMPQALNTASQTSPSGGLQAFSAALGQGQSAQQALAAYGGEQSATGNPEFDAALKPINDFLAKLQKNGQVLNPNVEITPEKVAEFTRIAQNEIDPYYASQLKLAREGFLRSVGYSQDELLRSEQELEKKYGKQVRQLGEQSAEQGFALSGLRQRDERDLAQNTQQTIDSNRRELSFNAGTAARTFAQKYGADQLTSSNITEAPRALAGQGSFQKGSRDLPFYELSPDTYQNLIGENEFLRRSQVRSRASELEGAFRSDLALNQARSLNF